MEVSKWLISDGVLCICNLIRHVMYYQFLDVIHCLGSALFFTVGLVNCLLHAFHQTFFNLWTWEKDKTWYTRRGSSVLSLDIYQHLPLSTQVVKFTMGHMYWFLDAFFFQSVNMRTSRHDFEVTDVKFLSTLTSYLTRKYLKYVGDRPPALF